MNRGTLPLEARFPVVPERCCGFPRRFGFCYRSRLYETSTPRAHTFVDDLIEMLGLHSFARAALDRALDLRRHALARRREWPRPGVAVRMPRGLALM